MNGKKLLSIFLIVSLLLSGCGQEKQSDHNETMADMTKSVTYEVLETVLVKEQSFEAVYSLEETDQVLPIIDEPVEASYDIEEWAKAYIVYLDLLENAQRYTYSLIYINEDDIPELVLDSGGEAGGCLIVTYCEGELDVLHTDRLDFDYIERGNLLCNSSGLMGYYYDNVYTVIDGKWCSVVKGKEIEYIDEDENWYFNYFWEEEEVDEEEYHRRLKEVYDKERAVEPERYYIFRDICSILRTGEVESASNYYELITEDLTWSQARKACEDKGGYLAVITSQEEMERIREQILQAEKTDIFFWIGAKREEFGFSWLEFGTDRSDYDMLDHYNALWKGFWQADEPSYRGNNEAGEEVWEGCVWLHYQKETEQCLLQDMPDDILKEHPSYAGKIGYICEYSVPSAEEKWITDEVRKQIQIYVDNREVWESDLYGGAGYYAWNDLDQDGRLELITSQEQGTGQFSYNEYYRITEDGREIKAIEHTRGEYSQMDILDGVDVYLDEATGKLVFLGEDTCKSMGTETTHTEIYFIYDGKEKLEETTLYSYTWDGKEGKYHYYIDRKEVTAEESRECKNKFLEGKTLTKNGFYWSSALEPQEGATLQMTDEELQIFLERLYAAYKEYTQSALP